MIPRPKPRRLLALAAAFAFAAPAALADADPARDEKKKAEEEAPPATAEKPPVENPLPKIVELMRSAERHLAESDTSRFTQEEQARIARALEGQQGAIEKLRELIRRAEENA